MKKVDQLKKDLLAACKFRGHTMKSIGFTIQGGRIRGGYTCRKCGKWAGYDTNPEPNGIDIGGEAVALGCED
jgi:hypothetical protein